MTTDSLGIDEISFLQLSDSFFPTGMYTTSSGLEALFYANKKIKDITTLKNLIKVYISQQIGPADCTALGNTYEYIIKSDFSSMLLVDKTIYSMKLVKEIRDASIRSGTQLIRTVNSFIKDNPILNTYYDSIKNGKAFGIYPVALAVVASIFNIPKQKAGFIMLYSFSVSMIGAALRLGMLTHFEGQQIIHDLKPLIVETVTININRPLSNIWQFTPQIDIFQILHENMESKMFIT